MKSPEKIRLFVPNIERFFLFLPLVFLALIPIEFIFFKDTPHLKDGLLTEIILNSVFLNVTHVALTYIMLFSFPEMRHWIVQQSGGRPYKFWLKNFFIFSALFVFFLIPYVHTQKDWIFLIFIILSGQAPFHHAIYQIRGLSSCYSQAIASTGLSEAEIRRFKSSELMEKYFFHLFFGLFLVFRLYFSTQQVPDIFERFSVFINFTFLQIFFFTSLTLLFLFLFYILKNLPKSSQSNKGLYLVRLLAFPLGQFSAFAAWASVLIHGTEYLCLFLKMSNKSAYPDKKKMLRMSVVVLVAFGLIYSALRIWLYSFGPDSEDIPIPLVILATTITSLNFLHYYLDRVLFRMRDSTTRENIAPLII